MPEIKITDLTNYTAPGSTDVFPVVDVPNDVTKKVSLANLLRSVPVGSAAAPGLAFLADGDTGFYSPSANSIAAAVGGARSLWVGDSNANSVFGNAALINNSTGTGNTAVGNYALFTNTTGTSNTAVGNLAFVANTTGLNNTAVGAATCYTCTTGAHNTALGTSALYNLTTGLANISIGPINSAGAYSPAFTITTQDNRISLGSTAVTNAYIQVAWTVVSDARDKTSFASVPHGLAFVNQLRPTAFQFKADRSVEEPTGPVRYGFKAQEILALEGGVGVIIDNEDPEKLRYNGEALVPVLVNAIQELSALVEDMQTEITALKGV
jgi:hypothetical protein